MLKKGGPRVKGGKEVNLREKRIILCFQHSIEL